MTDLTDKLIGASIRTYRKTKPISQKDLGRLLGVTSQQIQKYEKGVNRVSAARLHKIAEILEISVGRFFEGLEKEIFLEGVAEESPEEEALTSEMIALWHLYRELREEERRHILGIMKSLAQGRAEEVEKRKRK